MQGEVARQAEQLVDLQAGVPADLRVLIVASHRGLLSRIRAQFAGCSAWLTIPLKQAALIQYLQRNGSGSLKI